MEVAVYGTGNLACAFAASLLDRRHKVMLYAKEGHRKVFDRIEEFDQLDAIGKIEGRYYPKLTRDLPALIAFSKFLVITPPSTEYKEIVADLNGFDLEDHTIICIGANFEARYLDRQIRARCVVETSTSPYTCRGYDRGHPDKIWIKEIKSTLEISATSNRPTSGLRKRIDDIFSVKHTWCEGFVEAGFSNVNGFVHPLVALFNAAAIQRKSPFSFVHDGMQPGVIRSMKMIERELQPIRNAYMAKNLNFLDTFNRWYSKNFKSWEDLAENSAPHKMGNSAPTSLESRVFMDDNLLLAKWYWLGKKAKIDSPKIHALLTTAQMLCGINFLADGKAFLQRVGWENLTVNDIRQIGIIERPQSDMTAWKRHFGRLVVRRVVQCQI
ncbi:NAD/NADP octopine/nopaline dehydrogenase [Bisporella sp. PMI_857]|nr:NAD/NADP octopine/nopaline dehydrogenase [Bisporella sp. PMI_857]